MTIDPDALLIEKEAAHQYKELTKPKPQPEPEEQGREGDCSGKDFIQEPNRNSAIYGQGWCGC